MLGRVSRQLSTDVTRKAMSLASILEPLLIVGMGLVVMLIVLSVLLPIMESSTRWFVDVRGATDCTARLRYNGGMLSHILRFHESVGHSLRTSFRCVPDFASNRTRSAPGSTRSNPDRLSTPACGNADPFYPSTTAVSAYSSARRGASGKHGTRRKTHDFSSALDQRSTSKHGSQYGSPCPRRDSLLTTAAFPCWPPFPTPQWYIVGQHVREWLPNEGQRIAVLPLSPNAGQPSQTQWTNSTLLKTHCPDFAAWLSLMVDPNDWTKALFPPLKGISRRALHRSRSLELETVVP